MAFFKKSLLISTSLLLGVHGVLAMEEEEEKKQKYANWQGRYTKKHKLNPDVPTPSSEYEQAFSKLKGNEKPLAHEGEVYLDGSEHKKTVSDSTREDAAFVGPTHLNYLQRSEEGNPTYEAFGIPKAKDSKIDKGPYGRHHQPEFVELYSLTEKKMVTNKNRDKRRLSDSDTELVFDPGHGIDHAITITHNASNSTADKRNYTPQNAYYNRHIRNPLVQYAEDKKYSYKEFAIYPEHPLTITRLSKKKKEPQPIPEGFVFFLLDRVVGNIQEAYYFPNFHHYNQDPKPPKNAWEFFAKKYTIPNEVAYLIWGNNEISNEEARKDAQMLSEHTGYRALSGRVEVLPEAGWPVSARNALIRTSAIYRIQRAAEFDTTTENMLQVAQMFNSDFEYLEFQGTLHTPHLAKYWADRAHEEVERKGFPAEDIIFFMNYEDGLLLLPQTMFSLISIFEEQLLKTPHVNNVLKLLDYFDEKQMADKHDEWSTQLSGFVRKKEVKGAAVVSEDNLHELESTLSNPENVNIVLDFKVTPDTVGAITNGFQQRAILEKLGCEENLRFFEIHDVSQEVLYSIFELFHNGEADLRRTAIKLPFKRAELQNYLKEKYGYVTFTIMD